jgi:hypothetical protein
VGNKIDQEHARVVKEKEAEAYVEKNPELEFFAETSGTTATTEANRRFDARVYSRSFYIAAKTGAGVMELFNRVAREVVERGTAKPEGPKQSHITSPPASSSYSSLCCT